MVASCIAHLLSFRLAELKYDSIFLRNKWMPVKEKHSLIDLSVMVLKW